MTIRIFTDFDGTITRRDVGDALFERFGGSRALEAVREYRAGTISAAECFRRECAACGNVPLDELHAFLDREEIDGSFPEFVKFCSGEALPLSVVSDGMEYYIRRILGRFGLEGLDVHANTLDLVPGGSPAEVRFEPQFPNRDEVCDRCASCKRNYLVTSSADDDLIVYVGEGYSDRCPVQFADLVFAKDDLRNYCREENISSFEYRSFDDCRSRLVKLLEGRRPDGSVAGVRKRRQAVLARNDLFTGG
jgi:2,3-diketo-5-methylthio-1-phosphopentane phosphatase